jgi:hypothetical protein
MSQIPNYRCLAPRFFSVAIFLTGYTLQDLIYYDVGVAAPSWASDQCQDFYDFHILDGDSSSSLYFCQTRTSAIK